MFSVLRPFAVLTATSSGAFHTPPWDIDGDGNTELDECTPLTVPPFHIMGKADRKIFGQGLKGGKNAAGSGPCVCARSACVRACVRALLRAA